MIDDVCRRKDAEASEGAVIVGWLCGIDFFSRHVSIALACLCRRGAGDPAPERELLFIMIIRMAVNTTALIVINRQSPFSDQ